MTFLTGLFGSADTSIITVIMALAIVIVLIVLGVWLLKLIFNASGNVGRGRNRRLNVVDTLSIDAKRQLVLIKRDNVEHLLLIGGTSDLIVETQIQPPAGVKLPVKQPAAPTLAGVLPKKGTDRPTGKPQKPTRSLRHTGLLRANEREEPPLHPQTFTTESQFDAANESDSASNFAKAEELEVIVEPEDYPTGHDADVSTDSDVDLDGELSGNERRQKKQ